MLLSSYHHSFIVQATVITTVNYDRKTFIVQATGLNLEVSTGDRLNRGHLDSHQAISFAPGEIYIYRQDSRSN
jgi:hypothetical protein